MSLFRCPKSRSKLRLIDEEKTLVPLEFSEEPPKYLIVNETPILVDFNNSVLNELEVKKRLAKSVVRRKEHQGFSKVIKHLLSPQQKITRDNVARLHNHLLQLPEPAKVLVIAGGSIGQGLEPLYDCSRIKIFSFDLYASPYVQFVADAHNIPLPDQHFDAVIVQAALEHTLQPHEVVDEIWRVLKPDGLVYADTPFMQQVHEGAYDFTRFSESGHRYLFRQFETIASGTSGGPGVQFMWSIDYLVRGVFRSRLAGKVAKLAFFWTQYLDLLIPDSYAIDGASSVFFFGKKTQGKISPTDIITHYRGAQ